MLILAIAYQPLSIMLNISPSGQLLSILSMLFIVFFILSGDKILKRVVCNKLCLLWLTLIIYHMLNAYFQGVVYNSRISRFSDYSLFYASVFNCYFTMIFMINAYKRDTKKAIVSAIIGYFIFILFAFQLSAIDDTTEGVRLSGAIYSTQFAQAAGMGLLIIVFSHYLNKSNIVNTMLLSGIPILAIILCGSRNGFGIVLFALLSFILGFLFKKKLSIKNCIILLVVFVFVYYSVDYILNNTILGERVLMSQDKSEDFNLNTGTVLDYLGERGVYYLLGWNNFLEHPWFGIGMYNFLNYNKYDFPLHTEYMTHIAEGGIIGAALYFTFIYKIGKGLLLNFKDNMNSENAIIIVFFLT